MEVLIWLGVMVFMLFVEGTTYNLITIWFAGGALAAAAAAYLHVGVIFQMTIFLVVSLVLLLFTRPLAMKFMRNSKTKTNVDSLIGKSAVVTSEIHNLSQSGQVRINDVDWMARTKDDSERIPEGCVVEIEEVRGVHLIVKKREENS